MSYSDLIKQDNRSLQSPKAMLIDDERHNYMTLTLNEPKLTNVNITRIRSVEMDDDS
jgi:hypothetical protein